MTKAAVVLRTQALADLEGISDYISQHDPAAAQRVIQRIHRAIYSTIARLPLCGRPNAATGTREYPVPGLPYLIIYATANDIVDVVAVFHTSRDPASKPKP